MIQQAIVAIIVLCAAWAVARKYLPKIVRRRMAGIAGRVSRRAGLRRLATWLEADLPVTASCGDGCGSCGGCGPASDSGTVAKEFRISVESLKRPGPRKG